MCATVTDTARQRDVRDDSTLRERIAANPKPAATWAAVALGLIAVEFGALLAGIILVLDSALIGTTALVEVFVGVFSPAASETVLGFQQSATAFLDGLRSAANSIPTLLSRETIPNQGYKTGPNGPWENTFLGLEPAVAWAIRATLVYVYAFVLAYWAFRGWRVYRDHYRNADWTPRDDVVDRLRGHRWAQFGIVVVLVFATMALFAPSLGPTTVEQNIESPYSHEIQYFDAESGEVQTALAGDANFNSKSKGNGDQNVGPMTYDDFGRFHPFGTLTNGRDLFTFAVMGARVSLTVSALAMGLAGIIAIIMSLASAYYKGIVDLATILAADGITSIPQLLLLLMVAMAFRGHWLADVFNGGFLLALVFGLTGWPGLWRAVRGPALQVSEEEWIDAAESFGQRPSVTMRKHMLPYVLPYLLIYGSMAVGGIVIALSALSFIGGGLGINPPTPAWGRAIEMGRNYVSTQSWHIALIPGMLIVILVTGLNAFGDGIRDAIDPESEGGAEEEAAAGGTAG
ncbi:ABC transporter permease [Halosimplex aquaticum]|uniref:ABC transporter permease n=1 Tax=Halosimplex aquaticum TaxID=3026162 RepID=A0ABD5YD70_9EURY|nr:ABC transporter permease [Halosimplex aquaticum]